MPDDQNSSLDPEQVQSQIHNAVERIRKKLSEPVPDALVDPEAEHEDETGSQG
jgi:hypothetical protein